ncbi:hypothetical protein HPB50_012629 [Hyalomma asiaticum]|uniref:Uncharacterized protein n=1 Tax=Hyalomma asiaticum TaxID=266040 RepID=A0ACB7SC53_HYAAI|nr:hypothetical protein HPB50_012629 [Hyalomma asiaticum]
MQTRTLKRSPPPSDRKRTVACGLGGVEAHAVCCVDQRSRRKRLKSPKRTTRQLAVRRVNCLLAALGRRSERPEQSVGAPGEPKRDGTRARRWEVGRKKKTEEG